MTRKLEEFLSEIERRLPQICNEKDLLEHLPKIFTSRTTLDRMIKKGEVPPMLSINNHIYFLASDVVEWLRNHRYEDINA